MGACGCGETDGLVRLPAPGGKWYGIEVYPGCRDCGTNPELAVYTFTDDEDDYDWFSWEHVPVAEFGEYGQWALALLDQSKLIDAFEEWMGDTSDLDPGDGYDPPGAVHDFVREGELGRVIYQTLHPDRIDYPDPERR